MKREFAGITDDTDDTTQTIAFSLHMPNGKVGDTNKLPQADHSGQ